jgi:hypothetical protein
LSSNNHTFTIYAKENGCKDLFVYCNSNGTDYARWFNLETGVMGSASGGPTSTSMTPVGNGWHKIQISGNTDLVSIEVYLGNGTESISWLPDGTQGALMQFGQLEIGSYATSYIPTSGSAVTRVADAMPTHLNINRLNIGNSYTLFLDTDLNNVENNRVFSEIENSASSDVFTIRNVIGGIRVYNNLDSQYPTDALQSSTNKWVIRIDETSYKIFGANSSLSGSLPTARNIGEIKFYGNLTELKINNFNIYNTALSDAECQALTTI